MSDQLNCPKCRGMLKKIWSTKKQKHYWMCQSAEEECGAFYIDAGGKPKLPAKRSGPIADMPCPKCTAPMQKVETSAGVFYSCSRFPECKHTIDIAPNGSLAPLCPVDEEHGHMKLRTGKNGPFWSCRGWRDYGCGATREIDGSISKKQKAGA